MQAPVISPDDVAVLSKYMTDTYIHMYEDIYIYIYLMYTHIKKYLYIYMYIHIFIYIYIYTNMFMYICLCMIAHDVQALVISPDDVAVLSKYAPLKQSGGSFLGACMKRELN